MISRLRAPQARRGHAIGCSGFFLSSTSTCARFKASEYGIKVPDRILFAIRCESYDYTIVSELCGCRELGIEKREQKCPSSCRNTSVVTGIDAEIHQLYQVLMQRCISCIRYT